MDDTQVTRQQATGNSDQGGVQVVAQAVTSPVQNAQQTDSGQASQRGEQANPSTHDIRSGKNDMPTPVSGGPKESSPMPGLSSSEWVAPSTPEIVVPKELHEHMEAQPVVQPVSQSAQDAGVKLAKEAVPVVVSEPETIGLQTPRSVLQSLKKAHSSIKDSFRWFVELVTVAQDKKERAEQKGEI